MSPIETSELERRLGTGLAARAGQATLPGAEQGRTAIAGRVAQRGRRRRTVQVVTAVVVVGALLAAGIGLSRRHQQGDRVVTGVHEQVPPLPQLALPPSLGRTTVTILLPGNEVVEELSSLPRFSDVLSVGLSDQTLDQIRQAKTAAGVDVSLTRVGSHPAVLVVDHRTTVPSSTGVYWKPDAHHVAALASGDENVGEAARLAGQLVPVSDDAWWALTGGARSSFTTSSGTTGGTTPLRRSGSLDDLGARLGLGDGRTTAMQLHAGMDVTTVLDVPGFATGTFTLTTNFATPFTRPLAKAGQAGAVKVRGTFGIEEDRGPAVSGPGHQFALSWVEGSQVYQLRYGPPFRWDGQTTHSQGPLPTIGDAVRVAAELRTLSLDTWKALLSPDSLRLDLTSPGGVGCYSLACPIVPGGSTSTTSTVPGTATTGG